MLARSLAVAFVGSEARSVDVEVHVLPQGLPGLTMVGLAGKPVREAEQRIRSALECSKSDWPNRKIIANLAPSGLRKEGTHFDLALALAILAGDRAVPEGTLDGWLIVGELGLDGSVRSVPGVLPAAIACKEAGLRGLICPAANGTEAAIISGIEVAAVPSLDLAIAFLRGRWTPDPPGPPRPRTTDSALDLSEVRGHASAKRALELAASGGHNLLMSGPPGCGKTMLAHRLAGIMPPMTQAESLEVSRIHSVAGLLGEHGGLIVERPLRSPHHHVSLAGLIGGGSGLAKPGEVTLAHRGSLFLDELPLFPRHILESLRAPLEEGRIRIARSGGLVSYPCRFSLIGAMNPCPCGYHLDDRRSCTCHPSDRRRYLHKLSGPLIDRFDLFVGMQRPSRAELLDSPDGERSDVVRERVQKARALQGERYAGRWTNASAPRKHLREALDLTKDAARLLSGAMENALLSARGLDRVLRVALTIADLTGGDEIDDAAMGEAIALRVSAFDLGTAA